MYPVTSDFLEKMKADRRQVLARVAIDYTDPFMDQSLEIEANEQANVSYPQQTADSMDQTTHKYACLDGTWDLTSGEYHLAPSADQLTQQQFGWWGAQFCDQNGYFASPYPTLTVRHMPRPIRQLKVVGDTAREEYPVDFTVKLYGPEDTLLKTETVTGNDQVSWSKALEPPVLDVAKQVLEITKWSHAGRCAKIIEFFTSIREVYETGDLISIRLLEEREASQGSLPVGNISSNEIMLVLNNEDKKFDLDNENSPLKNLLKPNRRIQAWLGAEAENITAENPPTFTRNSIAYLSNGTQVAVNKPRFEQGAPGFGKAILIEEGTTNIITNGNCEEDLPKLDGAGGPMTLTAWELSAAAKHSGAKSLKMTTTSVSGSADRYVQLGAYTMNGLTAGQTYTFSAWVYVPSGQGIILNNVMLRFYDYTDAYNQVDSDTPTAYDTWQRLTVTRTIRAEATRAFVRLYIFQDIQNVYAYWDDIQLEQKAFDTSFIDGTRAVESLAIPGDVLNPQEGEISVWAYVTKRIIDGGSWQGFLCNRFTSNEWGFYVARSNSTEKVQFRLRFKTFIQDFDSPISLQEGDWMLITLKWDVDTIKLLFNGVVGIETENIYNVTFADITYIGSHRGVNEFANTLFDDLRISNRARTDEEILEAYQSGKPLPVDDWTTYKLNFDGNLYPNIKGPTWIPLGTFWSLDWDSPDDSLEATVTARDRMELLRKGTYQTSQVQQNKSLYQLAEAVLQDAGLNSSEYIIDTALQSIIVPYAWFNPVSHREALRRIAEAGLAAAFQNRDGKIQIESFLISGDEPVLEITEDDYFPPLRAPSRQDQVANEIIVDTQPLRPATTPEEVYRSNDPITIPANTTRTVTAFYNQQPVIEAVASLDNPPTGVSITEATYYGWGASIKIQNTTGTDAHVTLIIQGKPLTVQGKERVIVRDEASITENGVLTFEFPANPLVQTLAQAQAIADTLLSSVKDPRRDIEVDWRGNPALELGDRVTVKGKDYHIIRQEINWQGYLSARLTGRRAT